LLSDLFAALQWSQQTATASKEDVGGRKGEKNIAVKPMRGTMEEKARLIGQQFLWD
jgi:hypothetical protein